MKLLLLDNYDSFTYNLAVLFREEGLEVDIRRNDKISVEEAARYDCLAFSPGPGLPITAGNMIEIIRSCQNDKPMFGVCLGLQAIAMVLGAQLYNLEHVYHGRQMPVQVTHAGDAVFDTVPEVFQAGRYHSWAIDPATVPDSLEVIAVDGQGIIMAAKHTSKPIYGVQFHPESIMTPQGQTLVRNFINQVR